MVKETFLQFILVNILVDLMLRELNVGSDGRVYYDNLVHMMTQPLAQRR